MKRRKEIEENFEKTDVRKYREEITMEVLLDIREYVIS